MKEMFFDQTWLRADVAKYLMRKSKYGTYDGTPRTYDYAYSCRGYHVLTGSTVMFTRDDGMHDCGWWKNPYYSRCLHLSLGFRDSIVGLPKPKDEKSTKEWVGLFFGDNRKLLWCEPPFSKEGKKYDIWHYRLFCDKGWQPIKPSGEVYSMKNTPKHWKTWSEQGQPKMEGTE